MAGRVTIQFVILQIHLYTAFVVVVFLLMYFISGFLLVRGSWFSDKRSQSSRGKIELKISGEFGEQELLLYLKKEYSITGKPNYRRNRDGSQDIEFRSLSRLTQVKIPKDLETVTIERRRLSPREIIWTFHRIHGYGGGILYDIYMVMMDLTSVGLILFAVTGIYLWIKVLPSKKLGIIMLALGVGYTILVILTFV